MDSLVGCVCVVLLVAALTPEVEPYTDVYIEPVRGRGVEEPQPQHPYLWFGPRLGRRKRTLEERALLNNPVLQESVFSVFDDTPWGLEPFNNYQERSMVGQLAREVEELPDNSKAPPFAPRLGRRRKLLPFSPRLGREMEASDRVERSAPEESGKNQ